MGNLETRAKKGVSQVSGGLIGENLLDVVKDAILAQSVFKTIFKNNIFIDELPSYNDTILPAWEFRFNKELIQGGDLRHVGTVNSRILFPNNLAGMVSFHRKVALAVGRFFKAPRTDIFDNVSGLTEIGQNLDISYDMLFVQGGIKIPSIVFQIPFVFDVRRYRIENPEVPLDDDLDAALEEEWTQFIEISGVDEVADTKEVLIPESKLS